MNKFIIALIGLFMLTGIGYAKDKTVEFSWEKPVIEEDLAGFTIIEYDAVNDLATGLEIDIPYVSGVTEFETSVAINYPDGATTVRRYRILAYDKSMNKGQLSDPTEDYTVDFEAPGGCLNFKLKIIS